MAHFSPTVDEVTAPELARIFLHEVVRLRGVPASILSDRGTQFMSHFWREVCLLQTQPLMSTAFTRKQMVKLSV
jgi:hypothetical protein